MKRLLKHILIATLSLAAVVKLQAQTNEWDRVKTTADSSQRVWMKKILQVNDLVISQVFTIRDSMYLQVNAIRGNPSIPEKEQDNLVLTIRKKTGVAIRAALAETAYQLYKQRIHERLQQAGKNNEAPLTGADN